jgi:anaerobic ribonucleoside-triphosphate reductase
MNLTTQGLTANVGDTIKWSISSWVVTEVYEEKSPDGHQLGDIHIVDNEFDTRTRHPIGGAKEITHRAKPQHEPLFVGDSGWRA